MKTVEKHQHMDTPEIAARSVGARVLRSEDPRLLSGRGQFIADIELPGQLHVAFVRSPVAHARITHIDLSAVRDAEGVHLAWSGADAAQFCEGLVGEFAVEGCNPTTMPLLATDEVLYVGEPIAVVVAETRYAAEDACELLDWDFEELPAVVNADAAAAGVGVANPQLPDNFGLRGGASFGDVAGAFEQAHQIVEGRFYTCRVSAAPMETRGVIADYEWASKSLRVWSNTQMPHFLRYMLTAYLGFPEQNVEVITPDTGGGFGQKAHVYPEEMLLPLLAREVDRPVKWIEDRRENLMAGAHAHEQYVDIAYALDATGKITAVRTHALGDGGAYHAPPWSMAVEPWCAVVMTPTGLYDAPAAEYTYAAVATNKTPVGAYRGVGYMAGTFARECLADEAARATGMSPFEFRRHNVVPEFPWTNPQGIVYDEGSWRESIDVLESMVDYPAFLQRQAELRAQGRYIGLGLSFFVESSGESTAGSQEHGLGDVYHDTATVRLSPNGTAHVTIGLSAQGQGLATTMAQMAADTLGVRVEDVIVETARSTSHAYGSGTIGSRGAVIAGGAVSRAAGVVREKIRAVAANLLEAAVDDVDLVDGNASVKGAPDTSISIAEVATAIYFDMSSWPEDFDPVLEATQAYDTARAMFSNGAHAMVVELDPETGFVRFEKVFSVEDCGTVINPNIVEGQIRGGVVQGIGASVFEELAYDESGQLLTTTFLDYGIPTMDVSPPFEIHHIETPSKHSASGVKGMGESGLIAAPAAVLNAVNDALTPFGVVLRELPLSPEKIRAAMSGATESAAPQVVAP
ncbi:xanthine dehydrogenase family protein molybdopterin-binding subunit [Nocardioides sp. SOB77]|uniref:Xanthine dehydrogenase family protein molybdopterin-binding subunit n=1 Tax=Nocardioides oceani TaxID=3058369 RepID=A0ABT8FCD7_9ACTN|nr:xanthine dehydrogenase family protein molybdopterin-binding subunit [Nocardioides oceani]MDN4172358.1 xanthine dehydrogenase family protein molybdopterin-binding subunit [Nocardioides oceani]